MFVSLFRAAWARARAMAGLSPRHPFGRKARLTPEKYRQLQSDASGRGSSLVETIELETGFTLHGDWVNELALHTQVVDKASELNWDHGRLLYSLLRQRIVARHPQDGPMVVLETGTARGFSAVCLSRALGDSGQAGIVLTLDPIPHDQKIFWNVIDDHQGRRTRQELLSAWNKELERIVFLTGSSKQVLRRLRVHRVHFAFLDAQHTEREVLREYFYVRDRQVAGDMIFFDDVTPSRYGGVVSAIDTVEASGHYDVVRYEGAEHRGYAVAVRK